MQIPQQLLQQIRQQSEALRQATGTGQHAVISVSWPEAVHRYVRSLAEKTSRLSLLGFGKGLQVDLPIERAWVPLRVLWTEIAGELRRDRALQEQGERLPVDVNAVFQTANGERWRGALLLGEPGAGKTTAARQLAWRLASGTVQPWELNLPAGICPVLLRFRDLSDAAAGADGGLKQFLTESLFRPLAPEGLQQPGTELWDSTTIPILWILDGLDEIVDHAVRQRIARWITQALHDRENDRFLVTCRFAGYNRAGISLGPGFREFHVQALNETDQQRFIYDWFTLVYERLGKNSQAADKAGRLLQKLSLSEYQTRKMRELTGNPMLLTVLCLVFHDNEDLPKQRSEVYAHCVKVLLEHWRKELYAAGAGSVPRQPLDAEAVEEVLQQLAWWLHSEDQRTSASLDQLAAQTEQVLGGLQPGVRQNLTSLQFLDRVREETGILAGEANGELSFLHLTFQEYLASKFAVANGQGEQLAVSASAAASDWWKETALLSLRSTRPFCGSFFRSLLQQPGLEQRPDLLEQCLNEAKFVDAEPFVEIVQQARQQPQRAATVLTMLQNRGRQLPALADAAAELLESGLRDLQSGPVAQRLRQAACELLLRADRKLPAMARGNDLATSYDERLQVSFVQIPAGAFQMGRKGYTDGDAPEHPVRITRPFLLATTPVTNAQYELFLQANAGFRKPNSWDDRRFNQPQQPVVGVSWDDAVAYCTWAGGRLPTEAEWEYACRAGSSGDFCFRDQQEQLSEYAWFDQNSGGTTQPVGLKQANAWGLQDVHGNVWEWCADRYAKDWYSYSPVDDPEGPRKGQRRVLRGGSWSIDSDYCSAWYRIFITPMSRYINIGFRLARTLPPDP
ncbi:MAG: SUMF1/EgtB/PvdO family nonheme iron enzyme [Planctomyces sp.]